MSSLLEFFSKFNRWITVACPFIFGLPGLLVAFFVPLVGLITTVISWLSNTANSSLVNGITQYASEISGHTFFQSEIWSVLSWMAGLDVLFDFLAAFLTIYAAFVGVVFVSVLGSVFILLGSLLIINTVRAIIRLITAGVCNV